MKVTTDTPDLLIVEDRPLLLGIVLSVFILVFVGFGMRLVLEGDLSGLLLALVGGGMGFGGLWGLVRRVQVVFDRPENYVEFRRRNLFGGKRVRLQLDEIDRAVIEESHSSKSGSTWRVALVIEAGQSAGRHPITLAYSNGSGHLRCADRINSWLAAA